MTESQIVAKIVEQASAIAKEIRKGNDIEIKTCNGGLKVLAVDKKVVR